MVSRYCRFYHEYMACVTTRNIILTKVSPVRWASSFGGMWEEGVRCICVCTHFCSFVVSVVYTKFVHVILRATTTTHSHPFRNPHRNSNSRIQHKSTREFTLFRVHSYESCCRVCVCFAHSRTKRTELTKQKQTASECPPSARPIRNKWNFACSDQSDCVFVNIG